MATLQVKLNNLKKILKRLGSALVAFSGGVDSTFLLKISRDVIGDKLCAAISGSRIHPSLELEEAKDIARRLGVEYIIVSTEELSQSKFVDNSSRRCYYCKKELFSRLKKLSKRRKLNYVLDGSNYDDLNDFRPGRKAASEFGVRSPLLEARLTKNDIRALSREVNLSPGINLLLPALVSRIAYGVRITRERLNRIEQARNS